MQISPIQDSRERGDLAPEVPFVRELKALIVEELDLRSIEADDIDDGAPLFGEGLGLDSLDALQLAMAVEERFGVRIPEGQEARPIFASILTLAAFVASARNTQ
jgi:acyl carrier protein